MSTGPKIKFLQKYQAHLLRCSKDFPPLSLTKFFFSPQITGNYMIQTQCMHENERNSSCSKRRLLLVIYIRINNYLSLQVSPNRVCYTFHSITITHVDERHNKTVGKRSSQPSQQLNPFRSLCFSLK